jgi:hypothetical protein
MSVSGASYINSIASLSVSMKAENSQTQLSVAVLKQFLDMQEMMGEALVEMMELSQATNVDTGTMLDVKA